MKKDNVKFEDKIKTLEHIIDELENGNIELEDSFTKYTEAITLVKECNEQLKDIEDKVSKIVLEDGTEENFDMPE